MQIIPFDKDSHVKDLKVALLSGDLDRLKSLRGTYGKRILLLETVDDMNKLSTMVIDQEKDVIDFVASFNSPHILDELKAEFFGRYVSRVLDGKPLDDLPWLKFIDFGLTPDEILIIHERLNREI